MKFKVKFSDGESCLVDASKSEVKGGVLVFYDALDESDGTRDSLYYAAGNWIECAKVDK